MGVALGERQQRARRREGEHGVAARARLGERGEHAAREAVAPVVRSALDAVGAVQEGEGSDAVAGVGVLVCVCASSPQAVDLHAPANQPKP